MLAILFIPVQDDFLSVCQAHSFGQAVILVPRRRKVLPNLAICLEKAIQEYLGPFVIKLGKMRRSGIEQLKKPLRNRISALLQERCYGHIKLRRFQNCVDVSLIRLKKPHFRQKMLEFRVVSQLFQQDIHILTVSFQQIPFML